MEPDLVVLAFFPNDITDMRDLQRDYLARPAQQVYGTSFMRWSRVTLINLEQRFAIMRFAHSLRAEMVSRVAQARRNSEAEQTRGESINSFLDCDAFKGVQDGPTQNCWNAYREWFAKTVHMLEESDVPMLVVGIPDYRQLPDLGNANQPQQIMSQLSEDAEVRFLDLMPVLRARAQVDTAYLMQYYPVTEGGADDSIAIAGYRGNGHMSAYGYRVVAEAIAEYLKSDSFWHTN